MIDIFDGFDVKVIYFIGVYFSWNKYFVFEFRVLVFDGGFKMIFVYYR